MSLNSFSVSFLDSAGSLLDTVWPRPLTRTDTGRGGVRGVVGIEGGVVSGC